LVARGADAEYVEIDSPHGHDAFLINLDQVGPPIKRFLEDNFA
jgi:homoserine O-acetyltransferase